MGDIEIGSCDTCKLETTVTRTYFRYPAKCECCGGSEDNHFEIVYTCSNCEPVAPTKITVSLKPLVLEEV